jgi:integrase
MALIKRNNTWWIDFTTPRGERIRCSARTEDKRAAQELHDRLKVEAWRVAQLDEKPRRSWEEAAYRWLTETSHKKSHNGDVTNMRWLHKQLKGKMLDELTRDFIAGIGEKKRKETSPATANRYLALIKSILRRAANEWEWLDKAPYIRLYPEPRRRIRWLTPKQANILLEELPPHLAEMARFSLATGLKSSNVTKLEWSQVDIKRKTAWIHGDQAKGKQDIHVTLNATALEVLTRQLGKHSRWVFTYQGKAIQQVNTKAWRNALKRAGIESFRWHDLRHTWASWLAQGGVPLNVLQEMGGWESAEMVRRYAHLSPEQFKIHARIVDHVLNGTNTAQ